MPINENANELKKENEEKQYRKERTEVKRNTDTIIVTSENENDIYSEKVFDFEEFVEHSSNESAVKLRNLKEYGITDDIIVSLYKDLAGTVETVDTARELLPVIFKRLALQISLQPNGIVIDMDTGKMDPVASFAQAVETGIYAQSSIITESTEDFLVELGIDMANHYKDLKIEDAEEYIFLMNNFDYNFLNKKEIENDIDNFLKKDVSKLDFSDNLKRFVQEQKKVIAESPYENRMHLFEITKLEIEVERAKGTSLYDEKLRQRRKFYEQHKDYIGKVPIRNKDGSINLEEAGRFKNFKEAYQMQYILSQIDEYKNAKKEGRLDLLSKESIQNIIMGIVSGLKYSEKQSPELKEIVQDCTRILEELCPGLDLDDKDSKKTQMQIAKFAKEEMGFKGNRELLSYTTLSEFAFRQVDSAVSEFIITNEEVFKDGVNFDGVNVSGNLMYDSPVRNFFVGSGINFSEKDENSYNELYRTSTVNSWLESKEEAIQTRYLVLSALKEKYADQPSNVKQYEGQLKDMEKKFGKIDIDENLKFGPDDVNGFSQNFINASLTKYYTRDALNFQKGMTYEQLKAKDKSEYIIKTVAGLKHLDDGGKDFSITKLALRRLEMMNTEDKKFVEFDEKGNPVVNKALIAEEMARCTRIKCKSYEELQGTAERVELKHLVKKLKEYTDLDKEYFLKLDNPDDYEKSMEQIEDIRIKSNTERIQRNLDQSQDENNLETQNNGKTPITTEEFNEATEKGTANWTEIYTGEQKDANHDPRVDEQHKEDTLLDDVTSELKVEDVYVQTEDLEKDNDKDKNTDIQKGFLGFVKRALKRIKRIFTGEEETLALESGKQESANVNSSNDKKEVLKVNDFNESLNAGITLQQQQEEARKFQENARNQEGKNEQSSERSNEGEHSK